MLFGSIITAVFDCDGMARWHCTAIGRWAYLRVRIYVRLAVNCLRYLGILAWHSHAPPSYEQALKLQQWTRIATLISDQVVG